MRAIIRASLGAMLVASFILAAPSDGLARHRGGESHEPHGKHDLGSSSGGDECLVEIHDDTGALADGTTLCQTATKHICTFDLALCLNGSEPGCTPADFAPQAFRASGHCGPVGQLRLQSNGSASVCGAFTGVKVHTRGKAQGECTIRAEVRSAKVGARVDVDRVTLLCLPPGGQCPASTTTTTSLGTTTTTTVPGTTTTTAVGTTSTTVASTTTTTAGGSTSTTVPGTTTTTGPASTTTTTGGASTTTTLAGFTRLSFTTAVGTASCGSAGLGTPASAPFSGQLASDTSCSTKIADLGLGCLYFGGGNATVVAGGKIPDAAASFLDISGPGALTGSPGTGAANCTVGAGPGRHCVNNNSLPACSADLDCGGSAGSCALDANCFFGPPLPILSPAPFAALTTCVLNVVQTSASGTFDAATGASSVSLPLASRVYISGNTASPCPRCVSGACDPSWKTNTNTTSPDTGAGCTPVGTQLTTTECRPALGGFQAPLPVNLTPLTSGTATETAASGIFCPSQTNAGAFGQPTTQCISESGSPAGSLSDAQPHPSALGSVFCIPATGNAAVDGVADLPGPGAIGLNGVAQLH